MGSRLVVSGNPVHPFLVALPLGVFTLAVLFDFAGLMSGVSLFSSVGYATIVVGLVVGACVAVAGVFDLAAIPRGTRAQKVALINGLLQLGVLLVFAAAWQTRSGTAGHVSGGALFTVELFALVTGGVAARLGYEVVARIGVGPRPERADLDAPELNAPDFGLPGLEGPIQPPAPPTGRLAAPRQRSAARSATSQSRRGTPGPARLAPAARPAPAPGPRRRSTTASAPAGSGGRPGLVRGQLAGQTVPSVVPAEGG